MSDSPFLPETNIQIAWDSTSLGYFKRCPQFYKYTMIDGWAERSESVHLRFGGEYHQAFQDYELSLATGIKHDDAVHDVVRALMERTADWDPDHPLKHRRSLVRSVILYLDKFKNDAAKTFVMKNGKPAVELSFRFELDWGPQATQIEPPYEGERQPYLLCGHLDKVVTFQDELFIMDHKTTTSTPGSYYFDQYEPDNQMSFYTLASRVIFESSIRGVIINVAQLLADDTRFVRGITYRTPDQIEEWTSDLRLWLSAAEACAVQGYWPKNDTACDKYGGCKFRKVCSKSPQVREQFLKSDFEKGEPWNPLKVR